MGTGLCFYYVREGGRVAVHGDRLSPRGLNRSPCTATQGLVPIPGSTTRDVDDEAHDMVYHKEDMLPQVMMAELYDIVSRRAESARLNRNLAAI